MIKLKCLQLDLSVERQANATILEVLFGPQYYIAPANINEVFVDSIPL